MIIIPIKLKKTKMFNSRKNNKLKILVNNKVKINWKIQIINKDSNN